MPIRSIDDGEWRDFYRVLRSDYRTRGAQRSTAARFDGERHRRRAKNAAQLLERKTRSRLGGIFDVRGFRPRSLGPILRVSQPGDVGQPLGQLPLGGNLQLIWNSEVELPLFKRVGIRGVVFLDAGNEYKIEDRY